MTYDHQIQSGKSNPTLVERNEDGSFTTETLKRAMKAFRKRLKLTRLDEVSRLGHDPLSRGERSTIVAVKPPEQYPQDVWDHLAEVGRLKCIGHGLYEPVSS